MTDAYSVDVNEFLTVLEDVEIRMATVGRTVDLWSVRLLALPADLARAAEPGFEQVFDRIQLKVRPGEGAPMVQYQRIVGGNGAEWDAVWELVSEGAAAATIEVEVDGVTIARVPVNFAL